MTTTDFCFFQPRDLKRSPIESTWSVSTINAVASAIRDAWREIETFDYWKARKFHPDHYHDEDELTAKMAEILNDRLETATTGMFKKEVFHVVVRDGKQSTATVSSTEQMPDLCFRLTRTAPGECREESALYVEAKLLDADGGCREYVVNGLHRFVSGHYAPQVTFGMMLGYCVTGFNDPGKELGRYFSRASSDDAKRCIAPVTFDTRGWHTTDHVRNAPATPKFKAVHVWVERPIVSAVLAAPASGSR